MFLRSLGLLLWCATVSVAFAAGRKVPQLTFAKRVHNFGLVAEEKGAVGCVFTFTNTGKASLVITNATADCGCTIPTYPLESIEPGQTGELRVSYNPEGRPGTFIKHVRVYSNASEAPIELEIKGTVTTLGGNEDRRYQLRVGGLQVSNKRLVFPIVSSADSSIVRLVVNNPTDKAIAVRFTQIPRFVSISKAAFTLAPNEPEELYLTTQPQFTRKPGFYLEPLLLEATPEGGKRATEGILIDVPVIEPSVARMREVAPEMQLLTYHDFGEREVSDTISGEIEISNTGNAPLKIYDFFSGSPALSLILDSRVVAPGEKTLLRYTLYMSLVKELGGVLAHNASLLVNDPHGPYRKIKFKASIKKQVQP